MRKADKMKFSEKARLGGNNPQRFTQVTAIEFMEDYSEQSRINFRGRIYCCFCSSAMSFVPRTDTPYFRHRKGKKGDVCKKISYISPDYTRSSDEINKILEEETTFNIKGHAKKPKNEKLSPPNVETSSEDDEPLGDLLETPKVPKPKHYKVDATDLTINEILTQILSGRDLSDKKFIFYGKSNSFNDIFIDFHKISKSMEHKLNDGNIRIYWGKFYRICCFKNHKACDLCKLTKTFIRKHSIFVYCAEPNKKEPIVRFKKACSNKMISTYRQLLNKHPDGYLSVITSRFQWGKRPIITVDDFKDNISYIFPNSPVRHHSKALG